MKNNDDFLIALPKKYEDFSQNTQSIQVKYDDLIKI